MTKSDGLRMSVVFMAGALAVLLLLLMAGTKPAEAAFPGKNGRIAYSANRDGNDTEIFTVKPDGSGRRQITDNPAFDFGPTFSPDGSKIAFYGKRAGNHHIFVRDADGEGGFARLTHNRAADDFDPAFSPDGARIVFERCQDDCEIYVMNADGTNQRQLTANSFSDFAPAFSPDGSRIVFQSSIEQFDTEIFVMDSDGTNQRPLTSNQVEDKDPGFSPDGSRITLASQRGGSDLEIFVMNADGTNQRQLTANATYEEEPSFSPNNRKITFRRVTDGDSEISVMNADGSSQTDVTSTSGSGFESSPAWQPRPATAP